MTHTTPPSDDARPAEGAAGELEPAPEPDAQTLAHLARRTRRRRRRSAIAQVLLVVLVFTAIAYQSDVRANRTEQDAADISVNVREEAPASDDGRSAAVFLDGFGTYDSDHLTDVLAPGVEAALGGESWSVSYGNAPLASERIADLILERAVERDRREIDLVGYSMGGIISIEVARQLAESPEVTVRSILLVSTPDGLDGLRPYQRSELDVAGTVARIPGAQYSTALRYIGEVYFMRDRYSSGGIGERLNGFVGALQQARRNLSGPKFPGTWLLVDQAFAIGAADLEREIDDIADLTSRKGPMPTMMYLGTAPPGHDYMVNDDVSSQRICGYAAQHGMDCYEREVPGAVHTAPERTADEYASTFAELREPFVTSIEQAHLRYLLRVSGRDAPEDPPAFDPDAPSADASADEDDGR